MIQIVTRLAIPQLSCELDCDEVLELPEVLKVVDFGRSVGDLFLKGRA
jgi:hypothetical protein